MNSKRLVIFLLIGLIIGLGDASAQDSWLGGTGYWSNGSYWSLGFPPPSTDNATISIGGSFVTLDLGNTTVNSLTLGGAVNGYTSTLTDDYNDSQPQQTLNITNGLNIGLSGSLNFGLASLNLSGSSSNSGSLLFFFAATLNNYGTLANYAYMEIDSSMNNYGTLSNISGQFDLEGQLNNYGTLNNISGPLGQFGGGGVIYNYGTLNNVSGLFIVGGLTNNYGTVNNFSEFVGSRTLNNYGTINNYYELGSVYSINNYSDMENYGELADVGGFLNYGTLNNNRGGTIDADEGLYNSNMLNNSGTINNTYVFENDGTLNNNTGGTINNSFRVFNDGTLNNFGVINNVVFYNDGTLNNYGQLNNSHYYFFNEDILENYSVITNYGQIYNDGIFVIARGAVLTNGTDATHNMGTYEGDAGSTVVDGLLSSVTPIQIYGGTLSGSGIIQGDVVMDGGRLSPGDSPGKLTILGNYTQLSGGTFFAELAGVTPGTQYDQLVVSGLATLDGTLDVALLNGFVVQLGDSFVLMTFVNETGRFSILDLPTLPSGEYWALSYNADDLALTDKPVPEPASLLLLGSGLIAAVGAFRRKINL